MKRFGTSARRLYLGNILRIARNTFISLAPTGSEGTGADIRKAPKSAVAGLGIAFAFAFIITNLSAQTVPTSGDVAADLANKALTDPRAMEILASLTTDIGPRLDGSDAEKRAAAWAKERLVQLGFDKVWMETFPLEHGWVRGAENAQVTSPSPQPLVVTALGGSVATPPEGIEAEIALFRTYEDLLAAPSPSLAGKIAVVTQPIARTQDGSGYEFAYKIRSEGPSQAARRGAIGYLLRSLGTDHHRVPHTGGMHYEDGMPRIPAAALSVPDAEQLERLVAKGGAVRVRMVLTPRDLGPVTSQNVIAELRGREKPDEIVLLGAHLDSWDLGTGAIDDGSGVAIVMAAAKMIGELSHRPRRTIRVVLYGSEETGIHGGEAYAKTHADELARHIIAAEPDLGQGPVYRFQTGVADPDERTLKRIRTALVPLGIVTGNNESHGSSDVEPLAAAHVPAVTLEMDATDYFDLHHTPDDTLDKIEPKRLNQCVAAYAVFTYLAAELNGEYRTPPPKPAK